MITLIVAHDLEKNIGKNGSLPWGRLPNDLDYFKAQTTGKFVVMGRKTYESIGKPLPNRDNIVLTRDWKAFRRSYPLDDVLVVRNIENILKIEKLGGEIFIIGGEEIYHQFLPHANRVLYTEVHGIFEGCDTKFPDPNIRGNWNKKEINHLPTDEDNEYAVTFYELVREEKPWESKLYSRFI
jgi:dihydrofolate reductase